MGHATVLVVDDERKIRDVVRSYLEHDGYSVLLADGGQKALEVFSNANPDLIVLDLMLPDINGEEVARTIRTISQVPIIMLTSRAGESDRIEGLKLGADDYIVKPFSPRELAARVEAVLRRANGGRIEKALSFDRGRLLIDTETREVKRDGEPVRLTRSEFDLLTALTSRPGRVYSRYELVTRIQGYDFEGYERTIDVHVANLRKKIEADPSNPQYVVTVVGVGYKIGVTRDA